MKKLLLLFAIPILFAATAFAGQRSGVIGTPVNVTPYNAGGGVSGAYNSADVYMRISCSAFAAPGAPGFTYCSATDATGKSGTCYSEDPAVFQAALGINNTSYVFFGWDKKGVCNQLAVHQDSYNDGKIHP